MEVFFMNLKRINNLWRVFIKDKNLTFYTNNINEAITIAWGLGDR